MKLPNHKTKIVCTIGKASNSEEMLEKLIDAGMNVARLNFSHGNLEEHRENIRRIRAVSARLDMPVAILADLPGPKIRIGKLKTEPITLQKDEPLILTTESLLGDLQKISVSLKNLPKIVKKGSLIYLNDGFIQLKVANVDGEEVHCKVLVGGPLSSHKGLNLPGANIDTKAVTAKDLEFVEFGLREGIDAFSISFVKTAEDVHEVREFAKKQKKSIFIVAKIEREVAVKNCESILEAADAVMVARGDLGVEIPLEQVPMVQKRLIHMANLMSRPVITATQMLESMIDQIRPTRAEVTDVANAILDGTDAIMLSAETAVGKNPVEAVATMAKIAAFTEKQRHAQAAALTLREHWRADHGPSEATVIDTISLDVAETVDQLKIRHILAPTDTGETARRISRFKPQCWILAFTASEQSRNCLALSWGVQPIMMPHPASTWDKQLVKYVEEQKLADKNDRLLLTEGIPLGKDTGTNSLRIITLA